MAPCSSEVTSVAADCFVVHLRGESFEPCLAVALRHIHRQIRVTKEAAGTVDVGAPHGYADADV
jgi:hypothetical protein